MADSLALIKTRIDRKLAEWGDRELSPEHFEAQIISFVVGNSFDVFEQAGTVSEASVRRTLSQRLNIHR